MRVEQIETDLYLAIGDAFDSNSTILLSDKEALVIDALGSKRDAHDLKHLIEQNFEARVRFIHLYTLLQRPSRCIEIISG